MEWLWLVVIGVSAWMLLTAASEAVRHLKAIRESLAEISSSLDTLKSGVALLCFQDKQLREHEEEFTHYSDDPPAP